MPCSLPLYRSATTGRRIRSTGGRTGRVPQTRRPMTAPEQARQEREKLSALLRQLRADAGLTSAGAAKKAGFSQSKLSKVENGLLLPSETDVRALCGAYRATVSQRREVVGLTQRLQNEYDSARVILQRGAYRKQQQIGRIEAQTSLFRDFQPT